MVPSSEGNQEPANNESQAVARHCGSGIAIAVVAWVVAVFAGATFLLRYSFSGNVSADIPTLYPAAAFSGDAESDAGRLRVFAFLHPRCPCSRATLIQLAEVARHDRNVADFHVVFFCPVDQADSWVQHELWDLAEHCAGLNCWIDRGGLLTTKFGVRSSGHVLAFGPGGQRLFSGGITVSRGHEGESLGSQLLTTICSGCEISPVNLPVFGCEISDRGVPSGGRQS